MARVSLGPPVSGAYICPVITIPANATTSTASEAELALPAGLAATLIGVSIEGQGLTSTPVIEVGTAGDANAYLASVAITTNATISFPDGAGAASSRASISAGSVVVVTATNGAAEAHGAVRVGLWMYVTAHANNVPDGDGGA